MCNVTVTALSHTPNPKAFPKKTNEGELSPQIDPKAGESVPSVQVINLIASDVGENRKKLMGVSPNVSSFTVYVQFILFYH